MPKLTPAELSRMKYEKESREQQEFLARRRHEELTRQAMMQRDPRLQAAAAAAGVCLLPTLKRRFNIKFPSNLNRRQHLQLQLQWFSNSNKTERQGQQPNLHRLSRKYGLNLYHRLISLSSSESQRQWHQRSQGLGCLLSTCYKLKLPKPKLAPLLRPHRLRPRPSRKCRYKVVLFPLSRDFPFLLVPICRPHTNRALQRHHLGWHHKHLLHVAEALHPMLLLRDHPRRNHTYPCSFRCLEMAVHDRLITSLW